MRILTRLMVFSVPMLLAGCSEYNLWDDPGNDVPPRGDDNDDIDPNAPAPDIKVDPPELSFGWKLVDCPADPQTVTVSNVGDDVLDVSEIKLDGAGAGTFSLKDAGSFSLNPGESRTFEVGFTAGSVQDYTVEVQVVSNDPDESTAVVDVKGAGAETSINEQIFTQPDVSDVDVLWVVDNSGSMSDIVTHLGDRFESFLNSFDTLGINYRIAVVSTDMDSEGHKGAFQGPTKVIEKGKGNPLAEFRQATDLGSAGSGSEKGADAAYAALTSPLIDSENAGFLRDEAVLAVVVISDEDDDSTIGEGTFTSWLDDYKGDPAMTSFSAVVGDDKGLFGCQSSGFPPVTATAGTKYIKYQKATGGTFQSICDEDFDEVLAYLGYGASGLAFEFKLDRTPRSPAGIKVEVDGKEVRRSLRDGYIYDSVSNSVRFAKTAVPGPNAVVVISYPVDEDC